MNINEARITEKKIEKRLYLYVESTPIAKLMVCQDTKLKEILTLADETFSKYLRDEIPKRNILRDDSTKEASIKYNKILRFDVENYVPTNVLENKSYEDFLLYDSIKDDGQKRQGGLQYIKDTRKTKTTTQCVKAVELRKIGYKNLEEWMQDTNNVYVGGRGGIKIIDSNGDRKMFYFAKTKWTTPYPVEEGMELEESLKLYRLYLEENKRIPMLHELKGKVLGCFCEQNSDGISCHAQILQELCNNL